MNRSHLGWLLILLGATPGALGDDDSPFMTGQRDLVFEEAAPESSDATLRRRMGIDKKPPAYEIAKEKFRVVVPRAYRREDAWGLFVWIDAGPEPALPGDWGPVLAEKKLLTVGPLDAGNSRDGLTRCRLAVDAVHNMKRRFHVDPGRVYVSGVSGGGRVASMLGVAYADVFAGAFPIVGANFYKPVPTGKPDEYWFSSYRPVAPVVASAKKKNRYVLLSGETDFNRDNTERVYRDGFLAQGFRHVLYLEVPGMGHSRPPAAWLARGIDFLDGVDAPRD